MVAEEEKIYDRNNCNLQWFPISKPRGSGACNGKLEFDDSFVSFRDSSLPEKVRDGGTRKPGEKCSVKSFPKVSPETLPPPWKKKYFLLVTSGRNLNFLPGPFASGIKLDWIRQLRFLFLNFSLRKTVAFVCRSHDVLLQVYLPALPSAGRAAGWKVSYFLSQLSALVRYHVCITNHFQAFLLSVLFRRQRSGSIKFINIA